MGNQEGFCWLDFPRKHSAAGRVLREGRKAVRLNRERSCVMPFQEKPLEGLQGCSRVVLDLYRCLVLKPNIKP